MATMRVLGAFAAAGCLLVLGFGAGTAAPTGAARTHVVAAPPGPRNPAQLRMRAVIREWSARLNAGDYAGIARLFTLPAVMVQPPYAYRLTTRHEVALWHSGLPCAGTVVSITYEGNKYATAVFRLGNRGKIKCDSPGGLAAARFEFVGGKIRSWLQVPVPKGAETGPVA
jgi:hypothetical protein